ncbi:hypothetical protein [Nocardia goodfellowii]|uniref:Uncharacterized protein n=1 Tax=Nocardia goodfellowii TaxID=882446 RepID=A0ABS4QBM0_9NOCA|nr:hypothetical protein [Nocardia goodfellowii]MBP2188498.1 hypothetical protein [Nocardia goodfellowii]
MSKTPIPVRIAVVGIGMHAINHIVVLLIPPFGWNPGTIYHSIGAPLYAALLLPIRRGRNWARVTITILLGCQFAGRFVVWALFPASGVHAALLFGWTLSTVILLLLWLPAAARNHFQRASTVLTTSADSGKLR